MIAWIKSLFAKPEAPPAEPATATAAPFDLATATLDEVLAEAQRQQHAADELREYRKALQRRAAELRGDR